MLSQLAPLDVEPLGGALGNSDRCARTGWALSMAQERREGGVERWGVYLCQAGTS